MRVFALSDIHVDYEANRQWVEGLSRMDYREDLLILAGDISHSTRLVHWCLTIFTDRFARVLYVPGNHDLWVFHEDSGTSLEKFQEVCRIIEGCGASMHPFHHGRLSIIPLLGWYDFSFGKPTSELLEAWADFRACRWPESFSPREVTDYFLKRNEGVLQMSNEILISFSHFLPRLDVMPSFIPMQRRMLYPVLGSTRLEEQIRRLRPSIHVYGHSHVNRRITLDNVVYINNAFGYPQETSITAKELVCIYEETVGK